MDKVKSDTLFQSQKGENKRCDYLLIAEDKLYFIELKTNSKADEVYKDECIQKFKAVDYITDYIDSVLVKFHNKTGFLNNLDKRYILFYKATPIHIIPTKAKIMKTNNFPENMKPYPVQNEATVDISTLIT